MLKRFPLMLATVISVAACTTTSDVNTTTEATPAPPAAEAAAPPPLVPPTVVADQNPLLAAWTGPFGGVPPFDKIRVEHFKPALETAMAENLREVDTIAGQSAPPTFENTIAALEKAGRTLDRA